MRAIVGLFKDSLSTYNLAYIVPNDWVWWKIDTVMAFFKVMADRDLEWLSRNVENPYSFWPRVEPDIPPSADHYTGNFYRSGKVITNYKKESGTRNFNHFDMGLEPSYVREGWSLVSRNFSYVTYCRVMFSHTDCDDLSPAFSSRTKILSGELVTSVVRSKLISRCTSRIPVVRCCPSHCTWVENGRLSNLFRQACHCHTNSHTAGLPTSGLPVAGNRVKILLGKYRERIPLGNKSTDGRMVLKRILQIFSLTVVQFNSLLLKQRIHFTSLYIYIYILLAFRL